MKLDIATLRDLKNTKEDILNTVKNLITDTSPTRQQWLKTREAMYLLKCSRGTLVNLVRKELIECSKIGGTRYYKTASIMKFMEKNV